jgi:hypothetical protein
VILNLLFIFPQLMDDFIERAIDCHQHFAVGFPRHEIVLVFGLDEKLGRFLLVAQIDRQFDNRQPLKEVCQLLRLLSNYLLGFVAQMAVPGRNLDLHVSSSSVGPRGCRGKSLPAGSASERRDNLRGNCNRRADGLQ